MSLSSLPISTRNFGFEQEHTIQKPLATQILEDVSLSMIDLDTIDLERAHLKKTTKSWLESINGGPKTDENLATGMAQQLSLILLASEFREQSASSLQKIIAVYTENVGKIAKSIIKRQPFPTEEDSKQHRVLVMGDIEPQVRQAMFLLVALHDKIERTISRMKKIGVDLKLPSDLPPINISEKDCSIFSPQLRTPLPPPPTIEQQLKVAFVPKELYQTFQRTPLSPDSPVIVGEFLLIPEADRQAPVAPADKEFPLPPTIDVTAHRILQPGETLGICYDPKWGNDPIAFAPCEEGVWKGHVPMNKEWKFVILVDGKVARWENTNNRYCDEETQAFIVPASEIYL